MPRQRELRSWVCKDCDDEMAAWELPCSSCGLCVACCECMDLFDADELGLDPEEDDERKYPGA